MLESLRRRPFLLLATLSAMALSAAATAGYACLVGPVLSRFKGNFGAEGDPSGLSFAGLTVPEIVFALILLGVLRTVAETLRRYLAARLQLAVIREFRGKLLSHLLALEPVILLRWPPGELASRIQVEVHGVRALLHVGVIQGIRSILVATALATVALRVDTGLAIPGLLVLPLAVAVIVLAARPARRLQRELYSAETAVVSDTAEALDGAAVLRAYAADALIWKKIDQGAAHSQLRGVSAETWGAIAAPIVELVAALGIGLVIGFAWSTRGALDLATSGTVLVALLLMYRPLHGLAQALFGWWSGLASLDRLDELLRLPADPAQPLAPRTEAVTSISFEALSFRYDQRLVLDEASASFRAGEFVAITGDSGVGKSTLLGLLAGVLRPSGGRITADGRIQSREEIIAMTAWMPQNPILFRDTILNNIALGSEYPDRGRVLDLARRVGAEAFIAGRPLGYDGCLQEGGSDLSMGQRQRLILARALYRETPVLLLDEPSSALDAGQECNVIRICREQADDGGLVIVATHREDFLCHADRVLELRDGMIIEWERETANARLH